MEDWENNQHYGLARRFLAARYSSNYNIIIMDDDILPTEESVDTLIINIQKEENIYGLYGRMLDKKFKYHTSLYFGQCHIVLTRCLITTIEMCKYFIDNYKIYEYDIVKKSKPFWNGEDILFNLLSIKKTDKFPVSIQLSHTNKNVITEHFFTSNSISGGTTHLDYRKHLTQKLVQDMDLGEKLKENKNNKKHLNCIYEFKNSNLIYYFLILLVAIVIILLYIRKFKLEIIKNAYRKITNRNIN